MAIRFRRKDEDEPKSEAAAKSHRSPSQYRMLLRCEAQYRYRYVLGLKSPPSAALLRGTATDTALDLNFARKLETGKDEPEARLLDAYVADFDAGRSRVDWSLEEEKPTVVRDAGLAPIRIYRREHCPSLSPMAIQPDLGMENARLGVTIVQYGDLLTTDGLIIDRKTSKKSPPTGRDGKPRPSSFDDELQVVSQRIGYEAKHGEAPTEVRLDYLVASKEGNVVKVSVKVDRRAMALYESIAERLEQRLQWQNSISWSAAIPNRGSFLCSKKFCGYWKQCEQDYGGRVKD